MIKKILFTLVFVLTSLFSLPQLQAEIIETNEILTIVDHLTPDALILANVTGTLYAPSNALADNQWRIYFSERAKEADLDDAAAQKVINKVKNMIVCSIPKRPVDEITPTMITAFQALDIPVIGITGKGLSTPFADDFALITSNHLKSTGIDLEKTLSFFKATPETTDAYTFAYGIIFTNGKPAGPAIVDFLERNPPSLPHVIMIDNSRKSLESAEIALKSIGVALTGLRYSKADELKEKFDPILGTIEFLAFLENGKIMLDDEAMQIKLANPTIDYIEQLDSLIIKMAYEDSIGS